MSPHQKEYSGAAKGELFVNGIPDIEKEIFEGCKAAVLDKDTSATCCGEFENYENRIPFVHVIEDRNVVYRPTAGGEYRENHAYLRYSVNVYTDDATGKKEKAKLLMTAICGYFDDLGMARIRCQPVACDGGNVYRMLACFEAVIDKDKKLYTPMKDEKAFR